MPADVAELVAAARDGDRDAFDELVKATYLDTYTLAYRLIGDEEDARDVVQESYLRAYRGLRRFRGDAQFSTWMYRITANCAATYLGKRKRNRHDELTDDIAIDEQLAVNPEARRRRRGPTRPPPGSAARAAAPSAGRGDPARHLRPPPRCDRRRARNLRVGGQGPAAPGPPQAPRGRVPADVEGGRGPCGVTSSPRRFPTPPTVRSCSTPRARVHVDQCLRCQAELVQYRKLLRALRAMRTEVLEPAPGSVARGAGRPGRGGRAQRAAQHAERSSGRLRRAGSPPRPPPARPVRSCWPRGLAAACPSPAESAGSLVSRSAGLGIAVCSMFGPEGRLLSCPLGPDPTTVRTQAPEYQGHDFP